MEKLIQSFKSKHIPVLEPGNPQYRHAIATSNLVFRFCRPDCVVQPENAAQVQDIIRETRTSIQQTKDPSIKLTIKCNGHSYAGHSTADTGISLDLRRMKRVKLDVKSMLVTMDAGCQWGEVYETLINGGYDGLVINGGRCPTVGVSGFILGGGLGPFTRSFGMGADTLVEATIVTATGDLVTVSESDPPTSKNGRLFWALRGAGQSNFGVVVEMKLRVQKLSNLQKTVVAGRYNWYPKGGLTDELMKAMNAFYATPWPRKMTIDTTWACDLTDSSNEGGVRFNVSFDGLKKEYNALIDTHIENKELKTQLKRRVLAEPSTRYLYETLAAQWFEETERAYPKNKSYELYSSFVFTNQDSNKLAKITKLIRDLMADFRADFKGEKVTFLVTWIHSGGKASDPPSNATAYYWRQAVFHAYVTVEWVDKWMERDMRAFLIKVKRELRPHSLDERAAFINFPDRDFPGGMHERAYFGDNMGPLREVKRLWDPEAFFKWPQGVKRPGDPDDDDDDEDQTDRLASEQWARRRRWQHNKPDDLEALFADAAERGFGEDEDE